MSVRKRERVENLSGGFEGPGGYVKGDEKGHASTYSFGISHNTYYSEKKIPLPHRAA